LVVYLLNAYLLVLILYGLILTLLGVFLSRKVRTTSAFFVADRKLNARLLFSTVLAANIGAGSTVGAAGLAYAIGLSAWWWVGSAGIGTIILAWTVGPKIRDLAADHGFLTVGDFLEHRYGTSVRVLISVLLWLGTLAILAGQLIAFAWILEVVAGTSKPIGCLLGGTVVIIYFSLGGLKGTAWVNMLQLSVKAVGFLMSVPLALAAVGGWSGLESKILTNPAHDPAYFDITGIGWVKILSYVVLLAPSFIVSPGLLQKIYGARDSRTVRVGVGVSGMVLLFFSFFPVILGMVAAAAFPELLHRELALPMVITELLPFWLGAILLASVFSAEVSSADAILFMLSTSLGKDLYQRFVNPRADDRTMLRISRGITVGAGALGVAGALALESVLSALEIFYGLLSVALFAPLVVGLYRKTPGLKACLAAVALSVPSAAVFHWLTAGDGIWILSPTAFGITVSFATLLLALLPVKQPTDFPRRT
jgi:SSS family solute:Na+ symporter